MRSKAVRHAGRCIGLVVLTGAGTAYAQEVRTSLTASTGASVETNPYNEPNSSGAEFAANAELRPMLSWNDEKTTLDLRGLAQFRQFLHRYGLEDNYSLDGQIVSRRSARVTLHGTASFSYSEGGFGSFGRPSITAADPLIPLTDPSGAAGSSGLTGAGSGDAAGAATAAPSLQNPLISLTDVNILGQRTRIRSIASMVGADVQLSARSQLSADLNARSMRFQTASYQDYNVLGAELRYNHSFNDLSSVGLIGSYSRTNYLDASEGDANVFSALASLDRRFGSRWSASLALGASFAEIDGRLGRPDLHYTSLTTRLRFCRQGEFSRFCLSGERSPQPAVNGNVRVSDSVAADYMLRLSQHQRFSLSGSYARTGRGRDPAVSDPAVQFASGSARLDNDFGQRLTAFATASVSKIFSPIAPRRANIGGAIGIQVHIGGAR